MPDLRRQMIVVTPLALPAVQGRMRRLEATPPAAITGITYPARLGSGALTIGPGGVSQQGGPDLLATVRFDDLAALLRWSDGTQMLVGNDGFRIRLAAEDWNGADQALSDLPGLVAPGQIVTFDGAGPAGRQAGSPPEQAQPPTRPSRSRRRSARARMAVYWLPLAIWLLLASIATAERLISLPLFGVLLAVTIGVKGTRAAQAYRRRRLGTKAGPGPQS
jgi:hypothetical protein